MDETYQARVELVAWLAREISHSDESKVMDTALELWQAPDEHLLKLAEVVMCRNSPIRRFLPRQKDMVYPVTTV